jgi:hypothetical protein
MQRARKDSVGDDDDIEDDEEVDAERMVMGTQHQSGSEDSE